MWNILRTLKERDSARLRQLEKDFAELASDVDTCLNAIPKIHAKLRMRAQRAAAAEIEEEPSTSSPSTDHSSPLPATSQPSALPRYSKSQLQQFARAKGLLQ